MFLKVPVLTERFRFRALYIVAGRGAGIGCWTLV